MWVRGCDDVCGGRSWWVVEGVVKGCWSSDLGEWDVCGHLGGHPSGKGRDLDMDVVQERVGVPAAKFANGGDVESIEMESHGSPGSQGVTADIGAGVAFLEQSNLGSSGSDHLVDVGGGDVPEGREHGVVKRTDGGCPGAPMGQNVVDTPRQGFDGAGG